MKRVSLHYLSIWYHFSIFNRIKQVPASIAKSNKQWVGYSISAPYCWFDLPQFDTIMTRVLGENLFDIMCDSVTIPAADLLCVTFQVQSVIHIALLKMNYKVTYVHREEEDAEANDIVKQRVMPTDSAKLTEAVIIDLTEYKVRLVEKKYEMLNGDKINYLSERFLQCYADLAPKKKFQILNKVINDINNHYPEDGIAKRLDMKSRLREEFTENQEIGRAHV